MVGKILAPVAQPLILGYWQECSGFADPDGNEETMDQPHIVNNSWGGTVNLLAG